MKFKILDLSQKQEWNNYISKLPIEQQDIYYTPEYYSLYEANGDGKVQCFVFEKDGDIALYPFLINSVNELGYDLDKEYYDIQGAYGYNGVVASTYDDKFIEKFYEVFSGFCTNQNIIAEFTRFHPILENYKFSKFFTNVIHYMKTVYLNLEKSYKDIWDTQYSSKNRNKIRKGRKSLYCTISQNTAHLEGFKQIYNETMQKIGADNYYYFSDKYYDNLLFGQNHIINVYDNSNEELQATMILMIHGHYAHYHLSGRASNCRNNAVNNFMLDEAIKYAQKNGCKLFHFGGGTTSGKDDSLLKFKQNFSKENGQFYIGKKIYNKKIYNEIIKKWKSNYPKKYKNNKNILLGYRITI